MKTMIRRNLHLLSVVAALVVAVTPALAAKGGGGHGGAGPTSTASCTVAGNAVAATGLPTDQVINFMVTDASGTSGWVLGYTADGTLTAYVPSASGATTYSFVSRTSGPDGSKYTVFASCSA